MRNSDEMMIFYLVEYFDWREGTENIIWMNETNNDSMMDYYFEKKLLSSSVVDSCQSQFLEIRNQIFNSKAKDIWWPSRWVPVQIFVKCRFAPLYYLHPFMNK